MINQFSDGGPSALSQPMVLDQIRFAAQQTIGVSTLGSMMLSVAEDVGRRHGEELLARLTAEVLGQNLGPRRQQVTGPVEWHMPATWWQHWKATTGTRWRVGRWWNRRHPPRMSTVTRHVTTWIVWEERVGYPQANVPLPGLGSPVMYVQPGEPAWWDEPSPPTYRN